MNALRWIEAGHPLGVPFVLIRTVHADLGGDLEAAVGIGARALIMAVEHYQEVSGAKEVEYLKIEGSLGDLWPIPEHEHAYVYVVLSAQATVLRVGARVCMR